MALFKVISQELEDTRAPVMMGPRIKEMSLGAAVYPAGFLVLRCDGLSAVLPIDGNLSPRAPLNIHISYINLVWMGMFWWFTPIIPSYSIPCLKNQKISNLPSL